LGAAVPALAWLGLYGVVFVMYCAVMCLALLVVFLRFANDHGAAWDGLAANAYGIYLLHYPIVTWMQYGLLGASLPVVLKAASVFVAAIILSWCVASLLRRVPLIERVV
jgi:surface polysaccharide O-acyltransferase-like enzyme